MYVAWTLAREIASYAPVLAFPTTGWDGHVRGSLTDRPTDAGSLCADLPSTDRPKRPCAKLRSRLRKNPACSEFRVYFVALLGGAAPKETCAKGPGV